MKGQVDRVIGLICEVFNQVTSYSNSNRYLIGPIAVANLQQAIDSERGDLANFRFLKQKKSVNLSNDNRVYPQSESDQLSAKQKALHI